jgi:hypothetical protein
MLKSRKFRKFKTFIILYTVLCIFFPYTLLAEQQTTYKVPKNSISYFSENPTSESIRVVAPPETIRTEPEIKQAKSDIKDAVVKADMPVKKHPLIKKVSPEPQPAINREVSLNRVDTEDETFEMTWEKPEESGKRVKAPVRVQAPEEKQKAPAIIKENQPEPIKIKKAGDKETTPAFAKLLARMQRRSAERKAEAQRLGIVLPSQGGDMNAVSPSLNKLNKEVRSLINRLEQKPAQNWGK